MKKIISILITAVFLLPTEAFCLRPRAVADSARALGFSPGNSMRLEIADEMETASRRAAFMILSDYNKAIKNKGYYVLGLASGNTPIRLYEILVLLAGKGLLDFSKITTFNMDEYEGLDPKAVGNMTPEDPGDPNISFTAFMYHYLFAKLLELRLIPVDYTAQNAHIFESNPIDAGAMCAAYERKITDSGGVDTWIGGVGRNGHIAFNEPRGQVMTAGKKVDVDSGTSADCVSRRMFLTQDTVEMRAPDFEYIDPNDPSKGRRWVSETDRGLIFVEPNAHGAREITRDEALQMVPRTGFTIGLKTFREARHQIILAGGKGKANAIRAGMKDMPNNDCALSLLQNCPNCDVIVDVEAAAELRGEAYAITDMAAVRDTFARHFPGEVKINSGPQALPDAKEVLSNHGGNSAAQTQI